MVGTNGFANARIPVYNNFKPVKEEGMTILSMKLILAGLMAAALMGLPGCSEGIDRGTGTPASTASSGGIDCGVSHPHAIGENIAESYDVPYEQVMTWFCEGYSFDNILIALETSEAVGVPAETLLEMLLDQEWEEIWVEVGLTSEP